MTIEQIDMLKLGIAPIDDRVVLNISSGLEWVLKNTTLEFDMNNDTELKALPSSVKLFLCDYHEISMIPKGVASESIEGLSQSFSQSKTENMIWESAYRLLSDYLKSPIQFVTAKKKWW